jgi:DNA-binding response OmpR family regulator
MRGVAAAPAAPAARRVLVIEDDADTATLWTDVLTAQGYAVTVQASALGVAAQLRAGRPDVLLLDLGLPFRSGASLLAELKADPATAAIPVVVRSAAPETLPPEYRGLAAAVLAKPVALATLSAAVRAAVTGTSVLRPR